MNSIHDICKKYMIKNYTVNDDGSIDVDVWLCRCDLIELPLIFNRINGYFICSHNRLTNLKGCPRWIGGHFDCSYNRLTSLEFSPDYVDSNFNCVSNKLTDNYCDSEIKGIFYTSLEQDGLEVNRSSIATNYNEWRKMYKRKQTLNELYTRYM